MSMFIFRRCSNYGLVTLLAVMCTAGCDHVAPAPAAEKLTATGTSLAGAPVVRSAVLDTAGAIAGTFVAPTDDSTVLRGNCSPDMWANFGIQFNHPDYQWIGVTVMTKKPIATGQTGDIPLDWLDVSFLTRDIDSLFFKGRATLEITRHDSAPGGRRMIGVLTATELAGSQDAAGQTLDARFEFDMDFSCGVS